MIVASNAFRDLEPAIALTFVQVMVLERKDLDAILDGYPIAREKVRLAAFRMALKRGFLEVAKRMKMETASVTRTTSTDARRPRHAITILRRRLKMEAVTSSHVLSLDATIPTPATTTRTWTSTMALACTHNSLTTVMGSA